MRVLYINPNRDSGQISSLLAQGQYEVTSVTNVSDALEMIGTRQFSAVLISEEIEDPESFHFISRVHREQPELLVFQLSVWHSELRETLELLEAIEKGGDEAQQ